MLCKCLKYDLKCGLVKDYKKYLIAVGLFLVAAVDFYIKTDGIEITVFDYYFYIFFGMEKHVPLPGSKFKFPALWMAVMMYSSYITLYYPYKDLNGYGKNIILFSQDKKVWYLSKCVWAFVSTAVYFSLAFIVVGVFALVVGAEPSCDLSMQTVTKLLPYLTAEKPLFSDDSMYYELGIIYYFLPITVAVTNNLIELFMSLFIKPFYAFIITVSYAVVSVYYLNGFMIGNYAMLGRNTAFISDGVNLKNGYIICFVVIISVAVIGMNVFKKQDILNREGA